jgi:signal transduction histidine kinase
MKSLNLSSSTKLAWILPWLVVTVLGAASIAYQTVQKHRALFETDSRIVHRLLSQQVVQHDAILTTLAFLQPFAQTSNQAAPEQRLTSLYPHILAVLRRDLGTAWTDASLAKAELVSRRTRRAALVDVDSKAGQYRLVLGDEPLSYALSIDMKRMVPWNDWPMQPDTSPVRVVLAFEGQSFELQSGKFTSSNLHWQFNFSKVLAAESQPFQVITSQHFDWKQLPWLWMLAWIVATSAVFFASAHLVNQRAARRRAEELLRLGQVARLNTLGELAAGVAHELNQPLTAVLANTQAAQRMLADKPPDMATVQHAMEQAAAQARRASEVVTRLRQVIERPESRTISQTVNLGETLHRALYLLEPEIKRLGIQVQVQADQLVWIQADPVALDQIVHNLITNAMQALEKSVRPAKSIIFTIRKQALFGDLSVADNGDGIALEVLPKLFDPFFSTRQGGLGLGLTLCESLTHSMGGTLLARNQIQSGAVFTLALPLANPDQK